MWQHSVNILFGLLMLVVLLVFRGSLYPVLGWFLLSASAVIIAAATWGWLDEFRQHPFPRNSELDSYPSY